MKTGWISRSLFCSACCCLIIGCGKVTHQSTNTPARDFQIPNSVTNVDQLVEFLVSPVPPKHTVGETDLSLDESVNGFTHPQVAAARQRLIEMGPSIYPNLAKHIEDGRYSYSYVVAAWLNFTVGDAVISIMAEGIEFNGYGYKARRNKLGSNTPPDFEMMISEIGREKYALYASTHSKAELQKEFVAWKLNKERSYGFTDTNQEITITMPYIKWLESH